MVEKGRRYGVQVNLRKCDANGTHSYFEKLVIVTCCGHMTP